MTFRVTFTPIIILRGTAERERGGEREKEGEKAREKGGKEGGRERERTNHNHQSALIRAI